MQIPSDSKDSEKDNDSEEDWNGEEDWNRENVLSSSGKNMVLNIAPLIVELICTQLNIMN